MALSRLLVANRGEVAVRAARQARFDALVAESYERGKALNVATVFEVDDVIDPADTRRILIETLRVAGTSVDSAP